MPFFKYTLLSLLVSIPYFTNAKTITFGIVPQQSAKKLAKSWVPVCNYLSQQTGNKVVFATAPNIPEFEKRVQQGAYDLAYMNPYHYVVYSEKSGYRAIVKAKDKKIKGIIVTKKGSPYKTLADLNNQTLAFPSPAAFAASILTRGAFAEKNIPITPKYVSSHDSVYLNISKGIYPAGGGVKRTFNGTAPSVRDDLKILWETKGFTPHAVAVNSKMDKATKEKLQKAFTALHQSSSRDILAPLKLRGFVNADHKDWDDVRALKLDLL